MPESITCISGWWNSNRLCKIVRFWHSEPSQRYTVAGAWSMSTSRFWSFNRECGKARRSQVKGWKRKPTKPNTCSCLDKNFFPTSKVLTLLRDVWSNELSPGEIGSFSILLLSGLKTARPILTKISIRTHSIPTDVLQASHLQLLYPSSPSSIWFVILSALDFQVLQYTRAWSAKAIGCSLQGSREDSRGESRGDSLREPVGFCLQDLWPYMLRVRSTCR
jgi:hypothetical protein